MYSMADWTALKNAMQPLTTAMMPVGSRKVSSLIVAADDDRRS